ncbi:hypothetical protein Q9966_014833 [Columba livia]|nr:hypothetical protein Q9966_014833 [Columba livia]
MTHSLHGGVGNNIQLSHAHIVRPPPNAFEHNAGVEWRISVEGALKEQSLILVLTYILDTQAVLCEESQGSMLLDDFFSSANSGKGRNKAMLQALTGLQFQLRGKLQDQEWTDKHSQEEAHAHYSQCHMPVPQYPGFNGFFPVGAHFSSDKAPAISEGSADPLMAPAGRQIPSNSLEVSGLTGANGDAGGAHLQGLVCNQRLLKNL